MKNRRTAASEENAAESPALGEEGASGSGSVTRFPSAPGSVFSAAKSGADLR